MILFAECEKFATISAEYALSSFILELTDAIAKAARGPIKMKCVRVHLLWQGEHDHRKFNSKTSLQCVRTLWTLTSAVSPLCTTELFHIISYFFYADYIHGNDKFDDNINN